MDPRRGDDRCSSRRPGARSRDHDSNDGTDRLDCAGLLGAGWCSFRGWEQQHLGLDRRTHDRRLVLGVALLVAWVAFERGFHPLLDLSLILRGPLTLPVLAGFFYGAELYGSQVAVALFLGLPASTGFGLGLMSGQLGLVLFAFGAAAFSGPC